MKFCNLTIYNDNPLLIRLNHQTLTLLPNSTFYRFLKGFHRTYPTGVAQGALTPQDNWSRPIWDLHAFYLLRPTLFLNLSLFFRTMHFEHPSVLSQFCIVTRLIKMHVIRFILYATDERTDWEPRRSYYIFAILNVLNAKGYQVQILWGWK